VLHVVGEFGLLSETFIAERIAELDRLGWEAWVATQSVSNRELFPFPPDERLLCPRPTIGQRAAHRLRGAHSGRDPSWWVDRALVKARPALVHAHFGWNAVEALPAVSQSGVPMIVGFHGYDVTVFPRYGFIDLGTESPAPPGDRAFPYRRLFERLRHALVVSRFLEDKLRRLGFGGDIHVVPSGIRLEGFPFRGPRTGGDGVRLLFVGRQVPYKGLDVLLNALARLVSRLSNVSLEVIGEGAIRPGNQALARELGLSRHVTFLGARSHPEVCAALQRADMLVVPSRTAPTGQADTLSNVVKEGLSVGVQVVATRSGGIPEAIPPRLRADLVPEDDPAALAERIEALLDERDHWMERARIGRAWVEEQFDWRQLAPRLGAAYEATLEDAAGSAAPTLPATGAQAR
jgi:glycosyltransferase involved in cell wall biosynthesis